MVTAWVVCWSRHSERYLIDFDDEALACAFALMLAEAGREGISVSAQEYAPDPERAARIWRRIEERIAEEWAVRAIS